MRRGDMMASDKDDDPQPELRSTDRSLAISLLRTRESVMQPIREMLSKSGISEQKWRVLRVVAESGPMDQTVLADRACLLLPSLTRILKAMEDDGLLDRRPSETDRRKTLVSIAPNGQAILEKHADESNAIFQRLRDNYGHDDMRKLLDMLERLQSIAP